ncbi:glycogen debranching protein GlgX [Variovorax dokdonensis]|uniref:Glycogen debranching protein GlgX n=1 Tax=Variovorax dokdonensis TaxID=344883 RepID=A0ABT7NA76_9BURK|nr:glycogen debranching protein GlgX [Variovorax dokdonensis]MDM0044850.1 glycogen debranching protein GlgX [Variovorax dokdonensis]
MLGHGTPYPLGASVALEGGINFAIAAPRADAVYLCLFDGLGLHEQQRLRLPACTDGVWHGRLPSARAGLVYGYRVHGPWAPAQGDRFNPAKLLLDPYAREVVGRYDGSDIFLGHDPADPSRRDTRDNASVALKARVVADAPPLAEPCSRIAASNRVLYELHVGSQTRLHPGVPPELRGSFAGLAHPSVLDHLQGLGVTTLSLMPVQFRADEARLQKLGLSNHWGYTPIGWFAPEQRYASGRAGVSPTQEFRALADAIHARGMELVIDVVYNHSAETDEAGPTLSLRGIDNALYYHLRPDEPSLYENWTGCGNCLNLSEPRVVQLVMDSLRHWATQMGVDGFRFDLAPVLARGPARSGGEFDPHAPLLAAIAQDPVLSQCLLIAEPWDIGPGGYRLGEFPPGWLEWNDRFRDTQRAFWLHRAVGRGALAQRLAGSSDAFQRNGRAPTASVNFVTAHDGFTLRDLVSYDERHNEANGEHNRDGHGHNLSRNCGVEGDTDDPHVLAERARLARTLLAALLLSQGTPMLLAGDEIGHTQRGNNNAYCQDNDITWLDWTRADLRLAGYVARVLALRREARPLARAHWWPARAEPGEPALHWLDPQGRPMTGSDWDDAESHALAMLFDAPSREPRWLLLINAQAAPVRFALPPGVWRLRLASDAEPDSQPQSSPLADAVDVPGGSLWLACASPDPNA